MFAHVVQMTKNDSNPFSTVISSAEYSFIQIFNILSNYNLQVKSLTMHLIALREMFDYCCALNNTLRYKQGLKHMHVAHAISGATNISTSTYHAVMFCNNSAGVLEIIARFLLVLLVFHS